MYDMYMHTCSVLIAMVALDGLSETFDTARHPRWVVIGQNAPCTKCNNPASRASVPIVIHHIIVVFSTAERILLSGTLRRLLLTVPLIIIGLCTNYHNL